MSTTEEQRRAAYRAADEAREAGIRSDDVLYRRRAVLESIVAKNRAAATIRVDHNGVVQPDLPPAA